MAADDVVDGTLTCTSIHLEYIMRSVLPRTAWSSVIHMDATPWLHWNLWWLLLASLANETVLDLVLQVCIHSWPPNIAPFEALHLSNPRVPFMDLFNHFFKLWWHYHSHPRGCSHRLYSVFLFSDPSLCPLMCLANLAAPTCEPWLELGLCPGANLGSGHQGGI